MARKELKNKPLVEAILEVRWELEKAQLGNERDPHYKLLLGRLFDRVKSEYPTHEQLPTASIPDELVAHTVQHRFRKAENGWPLVQLGPGIMTVNSTADYRWTDFEARGRDAVQTLYKAHPDVGRLRVTQLVLRYIDAVEFDYREKDAYEFLQDKLKARLSLPEVLFDQTGVAANPLSFSWQSAFKCQNPSGMISLRFATGQHEHRPAIVWESTVQTATNDLPDMPDEFEAWFKSAHDIIDDWFFKLIDGELERRFSDE